MTENQGFDEEIIVHAHSHMVEMEEQKRCIRNHVEEEVLDADKYWILGQGRRAAQ